MNDVKDEANEVDDGRQDKCQKLIRDQSKEEGRLLETDQDDESDEKSQPSVHVNQFAVQVPVLGFRHLVIRFSCIILKSVDVTNLNSIHDHDSDDCNLKDSSSDPCIESHLLFRTHTASCLGDVVGLRSVHVEGEVRGKWKTRQVLQLFL